MNITHGLVNLSDTEPALITLGDLAVSTSFEVTLNVQNVDGSAYVYIGGPEVSTSDYGYVIEPNASFGMQIVYKDVPLYAVSDTNESQVAVLKVAY